MCLCGLVVDNDRIHITSRAEVAERSVSVTNGAAVSAANDTLRGSIAPTKRR